MTSTTPSTPSPSAQGSLPLPETAPTTDKAKRPKEALAAGDIVTRLQASHPALLKGFTDVQATKLIRQALAEVAKALEAAPESVIRLQGMGQFIVTMRKQDKDGQVTTAKRVTFKPAKARPEGKTGRKKKGQRGHDASAS